MPEIDAEYNDESLLEILPRFRKSQQLVEVNENEIRVVMEDQDDILRGRFGIEDDNLEKCYSAKSHLSQIDNDSEQGSERWEEKKVTDEAEVTPRILSENQGIKVDLD